MDIQSEARRYEGKGMSYSRVETTGYRARRERATFLAREESVRIIEYARVKEHSDHGEEDVRKAVGWRVPGNEDVGCTGERLNVSRVRFTEVASPAELATACLANAIISSFATSVAD